MLKHSALLKFYTAAAVIVLAGCNADDKKPATQVAAKVNKEEISVHQINGVLSRTPNMSPERAKAAGQQVLERLIDQELMVQQAVESKLDRDPRVMQAIEGARREILARSYLDKLSAGLPKPSSEDVKGYYGKHPELFAERRIYNFNELAVGAKPDLLPRLQERMGKAKSLAEVGEWLKEQNLPIAANNTTKAAEQLPLELLPRFHVMKEGQIGVIPSRESILIVQLAAAKSAPIDEAAAKPIIEQFLLNQRRVEAVEKEIKSLREKGKVEYMGEFAQLAQAKSEAAAAKATPAPPAPATALPSAIDKGIAGLK